MAKKRASALRKATRAGAGRKVAARKSLARPGVSRARSLAAKRGWSTRRAEEKKRSDAARKGWQTRRRASTVSRKRQARKPQPVSQRAQRPARTTRPSKVVSVARRRAGREQRRAEEARQKIHGKTEYAVSADYKRRNRKGGAVSIQIALRGPANLSKADAERAVNYAIDNNGVAPAGFEIAIVDWRGRDYAGGTIVGAPEQAEKWRRFSAPLALAKLELSQVRKGKV